MARPLRVLRLGLTPYRSALELQLKAAARRTEAIRKKQMPCDHGFSGDTVYVPDLLLALEHPPVITVGRRSTFHNVRSPASLLESHGIDVVPTDRGGDVTFHGPGQVVLYPILALRELGVGARRYVEGLEEAMVRCAARYGVEAYGRVPGRSGVWVRASKGVAGGKVGVGADEGTERTGGKGGGKESEGKKSQEEEEEERKLGAVGVQVSHGVSRHGLAFNVTTDLAFFSHIVPCGIDDRGVTSLALEVERRRRGRVDEAQSRLWRAQSGGSALPVESLVELAGERGGGGGGGESDGRGSGQEGGVACGLSVEAVRDALIEEVVSEFGFAGEERVETEEEWLAGRP